MQQVQDALERLRALAASRPVARLAETFRRHGHELALVGGPVRDAFLGRPITDLDFTTDARPDRILELIRPIADAHWDVGRAFGTIGARVDGEQVEITTYRADAYDGLSRKPVVEFGDTIEGDLHRRDFTVGAMALALPELHLIDPTGGMDDLMQGVLRTPSSPAVSFGDDPLRMLRAVRFTSQLGFHLDSGAFDAIVELRSRITDISAERVREELVKLLATPQPRAGIELFVETGLAELVLPELPALQLERDDAHQHKDVYEHSIVVLERAIALERERTPDAAPDVVLRLAALLHDIGKPRTRRFGPGRKVTFYNHDVVGAKLARKRLAKLRFDNHAIASVSRLVELHMRVYNYEGAGWTDSAVRRFSRDAGPELDRLLILIRADITTRNQRRHDRLGFAIDDLERRIRDLAEQEELDSMRPELDGERIMQILDLKPGPQVGEAYRFLMDLRLDEGLIGEAAAEARLREWWASRDA
ncbi:CCA tRNA nucleotidyltransferase [Pseudoclavibacter endophyticus]|uniref:CCA tRNA nucleotidyltransferase n=1 Tax=Pseudoclavibacter endophyticus TaxID=1778590 RepID=A0A6H9WHR2_9MICO|nr:CCA tRNA nucleotidyltransferase [Pseudoclavibacter endophyticus]KAB1648007.1 CCA tRNA nucleotidyltransferase [Pseudoclavibacter endophyticus]GGA68990.1 CCA tRNA nucleotidyltransferase [Pseudoclavibacter endophyticus]